MNFHSFTGVCQGAESEGGKTTTTGKEIGVCEVFSTAEQFWSCLGPSSQFRTPEAQARQGIHS